MIKLKFDNPSIKKKMEIKQEFQSSSNTLIITKFEHLVDLIKKTNKLEEDPKNKIIGKTYSNHRKS